MSLNFLKRSEAPDIYSAPSFGFIYFKIDIIYPENIFITIKYN